MEERERAYLEAIVSLPDRSALFDAVNRGAEVIPRSTFRILGLRSEKPRSRPNRGRGAGSGLPHYSITNAEGSSDRRSPQRRSPGGGRNSTSKGS